jgi:capsular polysaccharide transport system permease protein
LTQARKLVSEAEAAVLEAQRRLTEFRNQEKFLNPANASMKVFELIQKLESERATVQTQITELLTNSPLSPALDGLRVRERALSDQIAAEQSKVVGTDGSLSNKFSAFERLELQRQFADRALSLALDAMDAAYQETRSKQLYIQTIVRPNRPDAALEPQRLRYILTTALACLTIYSMLWLLYAGAREHVHA